MTLRDVWESSSEAEKDMQLMLRDHEFPEDYPPEPVRSATVLKNYVDGKQTHPAVLVLSDLRPEEVN